MNWLQTLPTTSLRILVSLCLAIVYVLGAMTSGLTLHPIPGETLYTVGTFLLLMMGLDVTQWIQKRKTFGTTPDDPPATGTTDPRAFTGLQAHEDDAPAHVFDPGA